MFVQDSSCLLHELSASQLVALVTCSDTGSHNMLDLIQSLVPPHYVCNEYVLTSMEGYICIILFCLKYVFQTYNLIMKKYKSSLHVI